MQVFISWSGARSKCIAKVLADWIPSVIQAVDPWLSYDIEKGARWSDEIASSLEQSKVGIFCLTPDNLESPWLHFEAGAVSKTKDARACTFLVDVDPANVKPPLGAFQHTKFDKEDVFKLLEGINGKVQEVGEKQLDDARLRSGFDKYWPDLERALKECKPTKVATPAPTERNERDLLEEVLDTVRNIQRQITPASRGLDVPLRGSSDVAVTVNPLAFARLAEMEAALSGLEKMRSASDSDKMLMSNFLSSMSISDRKKLDEMLTQEALAREALKQGLLKGAAKGMPPPTMDGDQKKD